MKRKFVLIFASFSVSFLVMVALSFISIGRFNTFTDYSDDVMLSNKMVGMLYTTELLLKDMDRAERGYILTNDSTNRRNVLTAVDSLMPAVNALEKQLGKDAAQATNLVQLRKYIAARIENAIDDIHYIDTSRSNDASVFYFKGRKNMIWANRKLREMNRTANIQLSDKYNKQQFYQSLTTRTLKSLLIIFCLVTAVLLLLLAKVMRAGITSQDELQAHVVDLKRSHNELQDIAYAISHDLQEPLRKIQVFSNMLVSRKMSDKAEETKSTLQRINNAANRMQLLIAELVSLTNLTQTDENKHPVDLNKVVEGVQLDLQEKIRSRDAFIDVDKLPVLDGYENQLRILFTALLDNALKFARDNTNTDISIEYQQTSGKELYDIDKSVVRESFHCIAVMDNGIGFDNKYISNLFKIFRRLHAEQSQYEGKGIGLAICQRIMANHEGYIIGHGIPGGGATFKLFFPA